MASKLLRHVHLSSPTTYAHASSIQDHLVRKLLAYKAAPPSNLRPPQPTILTFSPLPIYTTGRRELHRPLSTSQQQRLTSPLPPLNNNPSIPSQTASIAAAYRGGQITFHGPGQLVIYPILDLKTSQLRSQTSSPTRQNNGISPRCYVHLLEGTTIATLSQYGISTRRTADPGVWLTPRDEDEQVLDQRGLKRADYKIAALGVHLRRNVTSHGVGLNITTDLRWFDRIVACGLEGKGVTSMLREGVHVPGGVRELGRVWVREFAQGLGLDNGDGKEGVVEREEEELLSEMEMGGRVE